MNSFEAIVLGLVQGLTEFIPISSSGHLILFQNLFGLGQDHLYLEFINIGTVLALLIYFRKRIISMFRDIFFKNNWRLARNIFIAALPAGIIGFIFADLIETNSFFASPWVVAVTLFVVGVLLVVLERLPHLSKLSDGQNLSLPRSVGIGLAQAAALIPGVSRSGATIIAGRISGLSASAAAEFSFLLSIPIMLGVILKVLLKGSDREYLFANLEPIAIGNIAALISGLLAIGFLMRYLANHDLAVFGYYRIGLSVVVVTVLLLQ